MAMDRTKARLPFLVACLLMAGCASLSIPSRRSVTVDSEPPGAEVWVNGQPAGMSGETLTFDAAEGPPTFRVVHSECQALEWKDPGHVNGLWVKDFWGVPLGALAGTSLAACFLYMTTKPNKI